VTGQEKVPFIVGMEQLGIKDEELISDFIILNESATKMDLCLLGVGGNDCDNLRHDRSSDVDPKKCWCFKNTGGRLHH